MTHVIHHGSIKLFLAYSVFPQYGSTIDNKVLIIVPLSLARHSVGKMIII